MTSDGIKPKNWNLQSFIWFYWVYIGFISGLFDSHFLDRIEPSGVKEGILSACPLMGGLHGGLSEGLIQNIRFTRVLLGL